MIQMLPAFFMLLYLILFGVGVYCLLILIKLINRGIKALDIYINNNE